MRIAYGILAHTNPKQVISLIEQLYSKKNYFIIHYDYRQPKPDRELLKRKFANKNNVYFVPSQKVYWGHKSIIDAELELIKFGLKKTKFNYFVLLSGQDWPIKTNQLIEDFFIKNNGKEFIKSRKMSTTPFDIRGTDRVKKLFFIKNTRYNINLPFIGQRNNQLLIKMISFMFHRIQLLIPKPNANKLIKELNLKEFYSGHQFWALSRPAIKYCIKFVKSHPKYLELIENSFASDEFFFQTILGNSSFKESISEEIHYIDWNSPPPRPKTLVIEDLNKLKQSNKLFARKIDFNIESSKALAKEFSTKDK